MRPELEGLSERAFDVVVVGGGAHGASAAQHLASKGYSVLVAEKGDFASGTSSRSSRLLHCGLTYLATDKERYGEQKGSLKKLFQEMVERIRGVLGARRVMKCRTQLVRTSPERLTSFTFYYPIYKDGVYSGWQMDLAFQILSFFSSRDAPLNYKRISASEARNLPLVKYIRGQEKLTFLAQFTEYQYNWAERIVVDTILDAERIGAVVRNYTVVSKIERKDSGWRIELSDNLAPGKTVTVSAKMLLNTAGPWVDKVNELVDRNIERQVAMVKGINVLMKFPDDCAGHGIEWLNKKDQQFYAIPWGPFHFVGPTSSPYQGNPEDAYPTEKEIEFVLKETNLAFPDMNLQRSDVVHSWAGIIARTYAPGEDIRRRIGAIHDLSKKGMPNALSVTEAPIMVHRDIGKRLQKLVQRRLRPSSTGQPLNYGPSEAPNADNSPLVSHKHPEIRLAHIRHSAKNEHVETLTDLMFRRVRLGWEGDVEREEVERIAQSIADIKGWGKDRIDRECADYATFVKKNFLDKCL